jgi:hypothetical protein
MMSTHDHPSRVSDVWHVGPARGAERCVARGGPQRGALLL